MTSTADIRARVRREILLIMLEVLDQPLKVVAKKLTATIDRAITDIEEACSENKKGKGERDGKHPGPIHQ